MAKVILALETSCDETSVAVVADGREIRANVISSQVPVHRRFGGVVPEVASRKHLEIINTLIDRALAEAGVQMAGLDAVAVTYGPGLVGSLLVGVSAAKALAFALGKPLIAVNHLEGHIYANFLADPALPFPQVCLVVSGGHTDLIYIAGHGNYRLLGQTRDDAAGEAFDKVARAMGLPYPGGPEIDKLALRGDPRAVSLPRAYLEEGSFDFSFSGLKSAVLNYLHRAGQRGEEVNKADLAASFQQAVVEVLVDKTMAAARHFGVGRVTMAGGVAANQGLRRSMEEKAAAAGIALSYPPPVLCTDNGAMIGCAAYYKFLRGDFAPLTLNAVPDLTLGRERY